MFQIYPMIKINSIYLVTLLFCQNVLSQDLQIFKHKFSIEPRIGFVKTFFKVNDPWGRISKIPNSRPSIGARLMYNKNETTKYILEFNHFKIGNSARFPSDGIYGFSVGSAFLQFAFLYQKEIVKTSNNKFSLYCNAGPGISFTFSPDAIGFDGGLNVNTNGDTIFENKQSYKINKPIYLSLNGTIGSRTEWNNRVYTTAFFSYSQSVSTNSVTLHNIEMTDYVLSQTQKATMRYTGSFSFIGVAFGYRF